MKCTRCASDSPFHWAHNRRPSIFASDNHFLAKNPEGQTLGQIVTGIREKKKAKGEEVPSLYNLGNKTTVKERIDKIISFKYFGVYTKATPSKGKA